MKQPTDYLKNIPQRHEEHKDFPYVLFCFVIFVPLREIQKITSKAIFKLFHGYTYPVIRSVNEFCYNYSKKISQTPLPLCFKALLTV